MKLLTKFIHWKRLLLGFCPKCNSDAPELYDCPVCEFYSGTYPPSKETKEKWKKRLCSIYGNK